jgi:hypothetical protein
LIGNNIRIIPLHVMSNMAPPSNRQSSGPATIQPFQCHIHLNAQLQTRSQQKGKGNARCKKAMPSSD